MLEGENAAFCVEVEEDEMEVHWFKDGLKLHETHHTILKSFGKTHILVFVNVAHQDLGVVTFVTGRSKTSSRLKVKGIFQGRVYSIAPEQRTFLGTETLTGAFSDPLSLSLRLSNLPAIITHPHSSSFPFLSFSHETLSPYLPRGGQNGCRPPQQCSS